MDMFKEQQMSIDMGGEVGAEVERLKSLVKIRKIPCHGVCRTDTTTMDIRGYPHEGGLADKTGKRWWVYVHCNNPVIRNGERGYCDYEMSWRHIR